jgi:PhzF family phenazine biosynthesis protein
MTVPFFQVDAFVSAKPFSGNPAGVCLLNGPADEKWMQSVAFEINHSETAFLYPEKDGYQLRWFSPTMEVALCGHATLASAHVLLETGKVPVSSEIRFHTLSGLLTAKEKDGWIQLDFPKTDPTSCEKPKGLEKALGCSVSTVQKTARCYVVELDSERSVRELKPDQPLVNNLLTGDLIGILVTARSKEYDFVSRFFAPKAGIPEDPVTGSAHCILAPYWAPRLDKTEFNAHQASPRGGDLLVTLEKERVLLKGRATTVTRGELLV